MNLVSPVFAGGDHDGKKSKDNGDNNCNHTERNQKLTTKTECENENINKDHSRDNENVNVLVCIQSANLKDTELLNSTVFGDTVEPAF